MVKNQWINTECTHLWIHPNWCCCKVFWLLLTQSQCSSLWILESLLGKMSVSTFHSHNVLCSTPCYRESIFHLMTSFNSTVEVVGFEHKWRIVILAVVVHHAVSTSSPVFSHPLTKRISCDLVLPISRSHHSTNTIILVYFYYLVFVIYS